MAHHGEPTRNAAGVCHARLAERHGHGLVGRPPTAAGACSNAMPVSNSRSVVPAWLISHSLRKIRSGSSRRMLDRRQICSGRCGVGLRRHRTLSSCAGSRAADRSVRRGRHADSRGLVDEERAVSGPDEIIHQSTRLRIMSALNALPRREMLEFKQLRVITGATDGNLGAHLTTLEKAASCGSSRISWVGSRGLESESRRRDGVPSRAMSPTCVKSWTATSAAPERSGIARWKA